MTDPNRTLRTSRTLPFTPAVIYCAFAAPALLASWWGPDGFSNSFEIFEFTTGGRWKFVMHGPDGRDYPNESVFQSLKPECEIVIRHSCEPYFTLNIQLTAVDGGTHLHWEQVFDEAHVAQAVQKIVGSANEQNLDRLTRTLAATAASGRP